MLLTRQSRKASPPELNMSAMIDVVFLLLIFFMCTSSFQKGEGDLPAKTPQVSTGQGAGDISEDIEAIHITIRQVQKGVLVSCDDCAFGTFGALLEHLKARRAIVDVPVVIEGEGQVPYGYIVAALDTCYQANLKQVAFSSKGG